MISPEGRVFAPFESCPGGGGGMVEDEIDRRITGALGHILPILPVITSKYKYSL